MPAPLTAEQKAKRKAIGAEIREARHSRGMTLDELARKVGHQYRRQDAERWESGRAPISNDLLQMICHQLGCPTPTGAGYDPDCRRKCRAWWCDEKIDRRQLKLLQRRIEQAVQEWIRVRKETANRLDYWPAAYPKDGMENRPAAVRLLAEKIRRKWDLGSAPIADVAQMLEEHRHIVVCLGAEFQSEPIVISALTQTWPIVVWAGEIPRENLGRRTMRYRMLRAAFVAMCAIRKVHEPSITPLAELMAVEVLLPKQALDTFVRGRNKITGRFVLALSRRYGLPTEAARKRIVEDLCLPKDYLRDQCQDLDNDEWRGEEQPFGGDLLIGR